MPRPSAAMPSTVTAERVGSGATSERICLNAQSSLNQSPAFDPLAAVKSTLIGELRLRPSSVA